MGNLSRFERITEAVEAACTEAGVPGGVLGVYSGGETHVHGFGVTNLDHPLPVTGETIFQIGSITKTYTALAVMRLVSDGKLDLDAPVQEYLPDFRVADEGVSAGVTVGELLTHTAGWDGDVFLDIDRNDSALESYVAALADNPQVFPPGTLFSYNNAAFSVAGRIIEVVTGEVFEEVVARLVFGPLGLSNSYFFPYEILTRRFSVGHVPLPEGHKVQRPWEIPRTANPAGAIACDVHDLLSYARFFMGDGTRDGEGLLKPGLLEALLTPRFPIWGPDSIGLGWFLSEVDGVRLAHHAGGTLGQVAQLTLAPERGFAFAMMANSTAALPVVERANREAVEAFLEIEAPAPRVEEAPDVNPERFVGTYSRPVLDVEVVRRDGQLFAILEQKSFLEVETEAPPLPPLEVGVCGENRLMFMGGPFDGRTLDFIEEDGEMRWVRMSQRVHRRVG